MLQTKRSFLDSAKERECLGSLDIQAINHYC